MGYVEPASVAEDMGGLRPLGITQEEESAYRFLLQKPAAPLSEIAKALAATPKKVRALMSSLLVKGFISQAPGTTPRFVALPPSIAVEGLAARRKEEIDRARIASIQELETLRDQKPGDLMELVTMVEGREVLLQQVAQLIETTQKEVMVFSRGPYIDAATIDQRQIDLLNRGVTVRTLYERSVLDGFSHLVKRYIEEGEQARITDTLPMKLYIFDRSVALIPLNMSDVGYGAVRLQSSLLLDALLELFEAFWDKATSLTIALEPIGGDAEAPGGELSDKDKHILMLMMGGIKDDSIARQVGLSTLSVRRRIAKMLKLLNAQTRFQAGLLAGKRGWL